MYFKTSGLITLTESYARPKINILDIVKCPEFRNLITVKKIKYDGR